VVVELRIVRYFLAVVDEGSVTQAAAAVRVAQPSLSRQLRQLEDSLGTPLFVRGRGRMRLSPAGRQFLPYARDLIARSEAAVSAMREPSAARSVSLTVIAHHTTVADVIAPFLATLGGDALKVTVHTAPSSSVFKAILSGDADLGVAMGPPPGELASRAIGSFAVFAQVPPGHPWVDRSAIGIEELVSEPLILLTAEHGTRRLFDGAVNDAGLTYRMVAEAVVSEVVQTLAAGGLGVAVVSDDERYGLHGMAIETAARDLRFELYAAWDPTHFAAETIASWAERLGRFTSDRRPPATVSGSGSAPPRRRRARCDSQTGC
jgi:DNA-binding transcriptional LysR family regulator